MLRFARRLSEEHGQSLILLVLAMTVMFVIGAIVVDVGLWLSERRGSQSDADFAALAGAYELLNPGALQSDAISAATNSLAANNQQGNATFVNSAPQVGYKSCFPTSPGYDAVSVDVEHKSHALFSGIFGIVSPKIGAHAKACVGAAEAPGNIVPFEINEGPGPCFDANSKPQFSALCPVEGGAHTSNPRGILDLDAAPQCSQAPGSGDIATMIEKGALGTCLINTNTPASCTLPNNGPWYDCVAVQTGNAKAVIDGTHARVTQSHLCDTNFGNNNGVDDFFETVVKVFDTGDPYTSIYAPRDCDPNTPGLQMSPRLVTLIVLKTAPDPGPTGLPIAAFAGFYIAGCLDENVTVTNQTVFSPSQADCNANGVQQLSPAANEGDLYVSAALPGPLASKSLTVRKVVVGGSNQPSAFTMIVNVNGSFFTSFPGSSTGTTVQVPNGSSYSVTETGPGGYVPSSVGCSGNISSGQTCTITNTFTTPTPSPSPTPTPSPTPGPTPTPGPATPTPTPNPNGDCGDPGGCVVYGRFVNIIYAGAPIGPPTSQTTAFGIALRE